MTLEPRLETSKKIDKPELSKATATGRPNSLKVVHGTSVSEMGSQMSTSDSENQKQDDELQSLAADVYDIIKDIQDPEKPNTLEELKVVFEEGIHMTRLHDMEDAYTVHIAFTPTVPHCSLATLIGLCIRVKLERSLPFKHKVDITITEGTHSTEESINKQINDKERIAAAMENPNLKELVEKCIKEEDY